MKKLTFTYFLLIVLLIPNVNAQITFVGFDQTQCGIISEPDYSYYNSVTCYHGNGYKIFYKKNLVFEKCLQLGGCSVIDLKFVNDSTGFLTESNSNGGTYIYKTANYFWARFSRLILPAVSARASARP